MNLIKHSELIKTLKKCRKQLDQYPDNIRVLNKYVKAEKNLNIYYGKHPDVYMMRNNIDIVN